MKKLLCLLLGLSAQMASALPFNGFYVMGGIGAATGIINDDELTLASLTGSIIDLALPSEPNLYGDSISGLMEIGYTHQLNNHFVLGAALTANYDNIEIHKTSTGGIVPTDSTIDLLSRFETSLSNEFALLFKPGYVWGQNTLFYGLIGPRWGNFVTNTHMQFTLPAGPGSIISFFDGDTVHGYELGLTLGAGIKQVVHDHLSIGLEYAYTTYGEIPGPHTFSSSDFGGGTVLTLENTHKLHAYTNTLMFTLTYRP